MAPALTRVLHVINGEFYSGASRVQDLLAGRLPERGYDVSFALLKAGAFAERRTHAHAELHDLSMRSRFDLRPAWRIARLVRDGGFRLLHSHTVRGALVCATAVRLVDVGWIHHVHSPAAEDTEGGLRNWWNAAAEDMVLGRADALITVSADLKEYVLRRKIRARRLAVVLNGVPAGGPLPPRTGPAHPCRIGTMALFRPRKGLDVLLRAVAALRADGGPSLRLQVVGGFETPAYEEAMRRLAAELGVMDVVDWLGFASDVGARFREMDVFALPSLHGEGVPMVVLEAMAFGTPVVASADGGVREVIRDGVDGRLVPPGDVPALAAALAQVAGDHGRWESLRRAAFARHAELFSDRAMARGVAAVYDEVRARGRGKEATCAPS